MVGIIRKNWLIVLLIFVIVLLLAKDLPGTGLVYRQAQDFGVGGAEAVKVSSLGILPPSPEAPPVETIDRLVVTNTSLSLKVEDVRLAIDSIVTEAEKLGGFLVDSSLDVPEGAASGHVSVRIPSDKLDQGLAAIRALGVKVVSENVYGTDITDQYVDLAARLATLETVKTKFEQILNSASRVQDILEVTRELTNLQSQIDSLTGRQKYLEQTAKLSLVTVYLATDELALPFAPAQPWRPEAIFKEAVRSLVTSLRGLGTGLIWIAVYLPAWGPVLLFAWWLRRRNKG